jgi:dihydrodipicolinate synthase/N-acetylneuraminate lyase
MQTPFVSSPENRRHFLKQMLASTPLFGCGAGLVNSAIAAPSFLRNERCKAVLRRLKGPMASIAMPYNKDYSIDHGSLRAWVDFMCENKAPILFMTHGDSELGFLSEKEMEAVIRTVATQARGRTLVLGGTGVWWTNRTIDFINRVEDSGVDAINVHLGRLTSKEDEIYDHLAQIDRRTEIPLLISDNKYSVDLMKRVAQIPKLIGDKCHEELYRYHAFIRGTREYDFSILSAGQMKHFLFGYLIGSPAYLCPLTPFAPQIGLEFYSALEKNDFVRARQMTFQYEDGLLAITGPLGYPQCYKSLLYLKGIYKTTLVRPPRKSNVPEELGPLMEFMKQNDLV